MFWVFAVGAKRACRIPPSVAVLASRSQSQSPVVRGAPLVHSTARSDGGDTQPAVGVWRPGGVLHYLIHKPMELPISQLKDACKVLTSICVGSKSGKTSLSVYQIEKFDLAYKGLALYLRVIDLAGADTDTLIILYCVLPELAKRTDLAQPLMDNVEQLLWQRRCEMEVQRKAVEIVTACTLRNATTKTAKYISCFTQIIRDNASTIPASKVPLLLQTLHPLRAHFHSGFEDALIAKVLSEFSTLRPNQVRVLLRALTRLGRLQDVAVVFERLDATYVAQFDSLDCRVALKAMCLAGCYKEEICRELVHKGFEVNNGFTSWRIIASALKIERPEYRLHDFIEMKLVGQEPLEVGSTKLEVAQLLSSLSIKHEVRRVLPLLGPDLLITQSQLLLEIGCESLLPLKKRLAEKLGYKVATMATWPKDPVKQITYLLQMLPQGTIQRARILQKSTIDSA